SANFGSLKATVDWQGSQLTMTSFRAAPRGWRRRGLTAAAVVAVLLCGLAGWALFLRPTSPEPAPMAGPPADQGLVPKQETKKPQEARKQEEPPGDPRILTVSQDSKDGGTFRTIGAALEQAKPGMTVRVLDAATYAETLAVNRASKHEGILIESPRQATLLVPEGSPEGLAITNVPSVTVRGFRLRPGGKDQILVGLGGRSQGTVLEDLEVHPSAGAGGCGIGVVFLAVGRGDPPVVIRRCQIRGG